MAKNGNAPDIITAAPFFDANKDIKYRILKYDFISEGLLEELTPYLKNELKEYRNSVPENVYKLSKVNGKFYGYDGNISNESSVLEKMYWYVNVDLAKKYDIDVDKMEQMGYEDWLPYLEKVYEGEKKSGTKNLKLIADYATPVLR
jgi:ABC-type glycerol-3-phosphate transport system substrate-binding protein